MMQRALAVYLDLMDGIRGYYARTEGDNAWAAYSAVLVLSLLSGVNLTAAALLVDIATDHRFAVIRTWATGHRLPHLIAMLLVVVLHLAFARQQGFFQRRGPSRSLTWRKRLRIYIAFTVVMFVIAVSVALVSGHGAR
jgi:hypothetical protein